MKHQNAAVALYCKQPYPNARWQSREVICSRGRLDGASDTLVYTYMFCTSVTSSTCTLASCNAVFAASLSCSAVCSATCDGKFVMVCLGMDKNRSKGQVPTGDNVLGAAVVLCSMYHCTAAYDHGMPGRQA